MRVALYHNLPPGGALRVAREFAQRCGPDVRCDLFTLAFGYDQVPFPEADGSRLFQPFVGAAHIESARSSPLIRVAGGRLSLLDQVRQISSMEHRVAARIDDGDYDVALVHPCWLTQTPSLLARLRTPTVFYMHEVRRASFEPDYAPRTRPSDPRRVPRWLAGLAIERELRRRDARAAQYPARILCNSEYTRDMIGRCYGREATVAHPGVDADLFRPDGEVAPTERPRVLSVGGLERFKGHHLVVSALALLPARERPELVLVYERCDEAYRREVLREAARAGVHVNERRGVSDTELATLYRSASVTVLAAALEPLGLVALESLASGTPVVAADEAGYRETVDDTVNGYLVERSSAGLASGITRVLRGDLATAPPAVRATVVPAWSWDTAVDRQVTVLRAVAESTSRE